MSEITITLSKIAAHRPCQTGWYKILKARGHNPCHWHDFPGDDTEFPLSDALESNGLYDVLWALRCAPEHNSLWRKYAVWCAAQIRHSMCDSRSLNALRVAWLHSECAASDEELAAARAAARAVARAAAWDVARAAAWAVECDAAWAAAWAVECDAARNAQEKKLREILYAGEWVGPCPVQDLIDAAT